MPARIAILAVVAVISTATAAASTSGVNWWAIHSGVTCGFGTGPIGEGVACVQTSQKGYGVSLTHTRVVVTRLSDHRVVFSRQQP